MGFRTKNDETEPMVELHDDGEGYVNISVGDTFIAVLNEDGSFELCDSVDQNEVGNLKLTDPGPDDGWGGHSRRVRVFFEGEELVLPSEIAKAEKKAAAKAEKKAAAKAKK